VILALFASGLAISLAIPDAGAIDRRTPAGEPRPLRVLFIGNSYTRFNDLPGMVREISHSVPNGPPLRTTREARGGVDLRVHWRSNSLRQRIGRGDYDAVVIQGHSLATIDRPWRFADYTRRFSERIRAANARLVLFQTWARHPRSSFYRSSPMRDRHEMFERIDAVYAELARELGATVAPVGRAWELASTEIPREPLHRPDGTHPAPAGTYLSACVLYGTLTGLDPRDASWRPYPMGATEARRIRRVAAASLLGADARR
jgi:hypothetical protein